MPLLELQHVQKPFTGASTTNSFPSRPTIGNLLLVAVCTFDSGGVASVVFSDNQVGNVYFKIKEDFCNATTYMAVYGCFVAGSSGTFTVTCDPANTGSFGSFMMTEMAYAYGVQTDGTPVAAHITSGTAISSGSFNTTNGDDLIVTYASAAGTSFDPTYTAGAGFTLVHELTDNTGSQELEMATRAVSAAGSYAGLLTGSLTATSSNIYACLAFALQAAVALAQPATVARRVPIQQRM